MMYKYCVNGKEKLMDVAIIITYNDSIEKPTDDDIKRALDVTSDLTYSFKRALN